MIDTTLVLLSAGESNRFELSSKKQWLRSDDTPLWLELANRISSYSQFCKTIIVSHKNEINYMKNFSDDFMYVEGGNTRQISMDNALKNVDSKFVLFTDVARACVPEFIIQNLYIYS